MRRKALLVDGPWSRVGTKNLDQGSMRLDVETSLVVERPVLASESESALHRDFEAPGEVTRGRLPEEGPRFHLKARAALLFAPIL